MSEATTEPTTEPAETQPPTTAPADPPKPTEQRKSLEDLLGGLDDTARAAILGEVGKARNEAKNLRDRLKEAEPLVAKYTESQEAAKTAEQRAQERAEKADARVAALLGRTVSAEVKALAADRFADPSDAAAFLDLKKYGNEDGDVDIEAITSDLADLLERKPHLGKSGPVVPGMKRNPAQGSSAQPPLGVGAQIAAAEAAGDIKTAIRLKASQAVSKD